MASPAHSSPLPSPTGAGGGKPEPNNGRRLLVVEDDDAIAEPMITGLEREGFTVTRATTGHAALAADPGDLVLLDLGLPDLDGTEVARQLRTRSTVPIIVVSARGEELDRVLLLESGADDYVIKPFSLRELIARIRAVQRRTDDCPTPPSHAQDDDAEIGPLTVNTRTRTVTIDGADIAVTPKEFDLLALLASDPGAVFPREQIMEQVWDAHWWGSTKTLDVHIAALRKKLGRPDWITNIRGVGFRLDPTL